MLRLSNAAETGFRLARRLSSQIVVVGRACYLAGLAEVYHPTESDPMMTPGAAGSSSAKPQPVAAPLSRAAIFLVVTINPDDDNVAAVRSLCGDLAAL